MSNPSGFTLIELLVVVAMIALLAALAIPQYQTYAARAYAASALTEITLSRNQYEIKINDGVANAADYTNPGALGIPAYTPRCAHIATAPINEAADGAVICTLNGSALVRGKVIRWSRSTTANWTCESDLPIAIRPTICSAI